MQLIPRYSSPSNGGNGPAAAAGGWDAPQGMWIYDGDVEGIDIDPDTNAWVDLADAGSPGSAVATSFVPIGDSGALRLVQSVENAFGAQMRPVTLAPDSEVLMRIIPEMRSTATPWTPATALNGSILAGVAAVYGINTGANEGYVAGGIQHTGASILAINTTMGRFAVGGLGSGIAGTTASGTGTGVNLARAFWDVRIKRVGAATRIYIRWPGGSWYNYSNADSTAINLATHVATTHVFIRAQSSTSTIANSILAAYKVFPDGLPADYD